jgi:hypothetical protein
MPERKMAAYVDPLDLLRRFVPTPLKAVYQFGAVRVIVQTNDFSLLPTASSVANPPGIVERNFEWILVRDADTSGALLPPIMLTSGALTIVQMGSACLLGLDQERRELLAFIGSDVHVRTHQEFLVPLFCRLTNEGALSDPLSDFARSQGEYYR